MTYRSRSGRVVAFTAIAMILDGRQATYTGQAQIVVAYSSRGPNVNNALLQTADVLKPTLMAPGSSTWAAWSQNSEGDHNIKVFIAQFGHYIQFLCAVPGVDGESVRQATGVGCPTKRKEWCSDLNTPSVMITNLIGSRTVTRILTNVAEFEIYHVIVTEPEGVKIKVTPQMFNISANATRHLKLMIEATKVTNAYNFGELLLRGSRKHAVRVPIIVYVSSVLGS
ncbi:hypothetical protein Ancab_015592 [Ancistrocladus abbreviatus]